MESKHTRGQIILWRDSTRISTTRNGNILRVIASVNRNKYIEDEEATSNAQLIADAFNVTNETNMTPRELQKSHAELLEALKLLVSDVDSYHTKEPTTWAQRKEKYFVTSQYLNHCNQAISNALKKLAK